MLSAAMLKHFSKNYSAYQSSQSADANDLLHESWRLARDQSAWVGSFGIGLGLGIVASSGLSVCNDLGCRLHLAGLLGQMILPALAGYITERMLHKNASETLGRTALILSCLLFFSLGADLILSILRGFAWYGQFFARFCCFTELRDAPQHVKKSRQCFDMTSSDDWREAEHPNLPEGDCEHPNHSERDAEHQDLPERPLDILLEDVNLSH